MRRRILLFCLLLAAPAWARTEAQQAAAALLSKFFHIADSPAPKTGGECWALLRPAQRALEDFKITHPAMYPEVVRELESAAFTYNNACATLARHGNIPLWGTVREQVYAAEEYLAEATSKSPATPAGEAKPKEAEKPQPAAETTAKPETEAKPAETPPASGAQIADLKVVEKAQAVLQVVQKLDSAFDLALGKDELQSRLIDAHAAVQEFAGSPESEVLPLTVLNLRLAVAYYRGRLGTDNDYATGSAKDALQKAREYLNNYKASGQEQPPKP